jgi:hypothetical protein
MGPPPWGQRDPTPEDVTDPELKRVIDELFDPSDMIPGGTAGAVRHERLTGQPTKGRWHTQKAQNRATQLQRMVDSGRLDGWDQQVAQWLLDDLRYALNGDQC